MGTSNGHDEVITCIVQKGMAEAVVKAALDAGAQGATVFDASGTGVRQRLGTEGEKLSPEKEVIIVAARSGMAGSIFDAMVSAGELEKPGRGFAYLQKAERSVGFLEEAL